MDPVKHNRACAYARWQLKDQQFESQLIMFKNRFASVTKISVDLISRAVWYSTK